MSYKRTSTLLFSISIVGMFVGYLLFYPEDIGICIQADNGVCGAPLARTVGEPLVLGMLPLAITFLILRFLPKDYFSAWMKFGVWYIPLAAVFISITPVSGGSFLAPDKEGMTWILAGIYIAVTMLIFIYKYIWLKLVHHA